MKSKNINVRSGEQTATRFKKLSEGRSQGAVIEQLIFLGEKIQLVKEGKFSPEALVMFIDFQFNTDMYKKLVEKGEGK